MVSKTGSKNGKRTTLLRKASRQAKLELPVDSYLYELERNQSQFQAE